MFIISEHTYTHTQTIWKSNDYDLNKHTQKLNKNLNCDKVKTSNKIRIQIN